MYLLIFNSTNYILIPVTSFDTCWPFIPYTLRYIKIYVWENLFTSMRTVIKSLKLISLVYWILAVFHVTVWLKAGKFVIQNVNGNVVSEQLKLILQYSRNLQNCIIIINFLSKSKYFRIKQLFPSKYCNRELLIFQKNK